jgi:hypothetical protein
LGIIVYQAHREVGDPDRKRRVVARELRGIWLGG